MTPATVVTGLLTVRTALGEVIDEPVPVNETLPAPWIVARPLKATPLGSTTLVAAWRAPLVRVRVPPLPRGWLLLPRTSTPLRAGLALAAGLAAVLRV